MQFYFETFETFLPIARPKIILPIIGSDRGKDHGSGDRRAGIESHIKSLGNVLIPFILGTIKAIFSQHRGQVRCEQLFVQWCDIHENYICGTVRS